MLLNSKRLVCVDALTGLWRSDPVGLVAATLPGVLMIALQKSAGHQGRWAASDDTIKVWDYFAIKVPLVLSRWPAWGDCPPFVCSPKIGILPVDKQLRLAQLALFGAVWRCLTLFGWNLGKKNLRTDDTTLLRPQYSTHSSNDLKSSLHYCTQSRWPCSTRCPAI